jgi:serine/threonine protein kinase/Tol biopolymer transport system component
MAISIGAQLGSYEVRSLLGKGGMGEVYRAHDSKLGRDVAIKVLPDNVASDPDRVARFEREARFLASLNHPRIASLFGMEDATGPRAEAVRFLVMELVEGETLADRLRHGALPPREALRLACHIAEAVEAAHEKGVIHRDLKPANIKITPDDQIKVLDFGLAKALDAAPAPGDVTHSPTLSMGTQAGMILGTAAYMSPEQAKGSAVDHRSDIFSFGTILYEMLTGRAPFKGDTAAEILASVLIRDPDFAALPSTLNPRVVDLLRRCLDKNPKRRWQAAGDLRAELETLAVSAEGASTIDAAPRRYKAARRGWLAWAALAAAALVALGLAIPAVMHLREGPPDVSAIRSTLLAPEGTTLDFIQGAGLPALSPDGRRVVFGARAADGRQPLWVRSLDGLTAQPLAGTEGAAFPFWSPDSRSVAFFADGKLKKIDTAGGPMLTLTDAPVGRGGTWNRQGVIVFSPSNALGLHRVSSAGGPSTPLSIQQGSFPWFLPDGEHFLYQPPGPEAGYSFRVGSLNSGEGAVLGVGSNAMYANGHLLFLRDGTLMAQPFDPDRLATTGDIVPLAEGVQTVLDSGRAGVFSVSDTGLLLYRQGVGSRRQLVWFDRTGKALGTVGEADSALEGDPALSPDGRRVTVVRTVQRNADIWIVDLVRGGTTRFTFDAAIDGSPIWSKDDTQIAFSSNRTSTGGTAVAFDVYSKPSSGAGAERLLLESPGGQFPDDWSADGVLLYRSLDSNVSSDLWALPMQGDRKPVAVATSRFTEANGRFSPDGRWIAYQSTESGRYEIYVVPFPAGSGKWQISIGGGIWPQWRRDGKELFYVTLDGHMMAVTIALSEISLEAAPPVPLFQTATFAGGAAVRPPYAVSADGQFLFSVSVADAISPSMTLFQNWMPSR